MKPYRWKMLRGDEKIIKCMKQDADLMHNLLDQINRPVRGSDYLQPGLLAGQSKLSVIEESAKSILNHVKTFSEERWMLP